MKKQFNSMSEKLKITLIICGTILTIGILSILFWTLFFSPIGKGISGMIVGAFATLLPDIINKIKQWLHKGDK